MSVQILALVLTTLLGGLVPLFVRHSERVLHLYVSFATGMFLGIVFLHLLPEVASQAEAGGGQRTLTWLCVLLGVVGLYLIQLALSGRKGAEQHAVMGWGSLFGLCIHAFATGMGFAAAATQPALELAVLMSLVTHKVAEGFSLATVFLLGGLARGRIVVVIGLFALVTPAGLYAGRWLAGHLSGSGLALFTALAAGTFLFVALFDLLPETFHERGDLAVKLLLVAGGVLASLGMHALGS